MASFLTRSFSFIQGAIGALGLELRASLADPASRSVQIMAVRGAPVNTPSGVGLAVNVDASGLNDLLYGYAGGAWNPAELDSSLSGFTDGSTWYTTDTLQGLADAVVAAVGGTSQGVRNYTNGYVVTDNQTLFASIDALDAAFGGAISTLTTTTKTLVGGINELDDEAKHQGSVAVARLLMANQPADGDTIGIGADTYSFTDTGVNTVVNNDAHIAVVIGGSAAATRANLIAAINGAGTAGATVTLADAVTPALEDGTENLLADEVGTTVRIRSASAPGGTVSGADPSIVLAESITDAADVWDVGAVNMNTLAGAVKALRLEATAVLTITAAMITNKVRVDFPFTVTGFLCQVRGSTGGLRTGVIGDLAVVDTGGILLTFDGGAAPAIQANDVVTIHAWS